MKKHIKTIIIMIVLVGLFVGYYLYISHRNVESNTEEIAAAKTVQDMTTVQKLIAEAAYKDYPATPVQLLKYYNEITVCFYNEEYTEDELKALALISRKMLDDETVAQQTDMEYLLQLEQDIAVMKSQGDHGTTIYSVDVTPSMDVFYFEHDGYECARLYDTFTVKQMVDGTIYYPVIRYVYVMRKDADGHWKILGFKKEEEGEPGTGDPLMGN
ncbi:MAG: hypothetical protein IKI75_10885 [Lachnospiraceae bacterium]|nr:hypothetical protein [Lachnospiraceae bacterium]